MPYLQGMQKIAATFFILFIVYWGGGAGVAVFRLHGLLESGFAGESAGGGALSERNGK